MPFSTKEVSREVLLAFWKVHILHHASEAPLHGHWMLEELRHHGYHISPGTLYPLLARMERRGISIDQEVLSRLSGEFAQEAAGLEAEIKEIAGEALFVHVHPGRQARPLARRWR
mgnify:CR=1 FL=1